MARKNKVKKEEKKIAKKVAKRYMRKAERKDETLLRKGLREIGIDGWAGDLAGRGIGALLDTGAGLVPWAGGFISGAAHAGGLWAKPPVNHLAGSGMPKQFVHTKNPKFTTLAKPSGEQFKAMVLDNSKTIFRSHVFPTLAAGKKMSSGAPLATGGSIPQSFFHTAEVARTMDNEVINAFSSRVFLGEIATGSTAKGDMLLSMDLDPSHGLLRQTYLGKQLGLYDRYSISHAALLYCPTTAATTDGGLLLATFSDPEKSLQDFGVGDARIEAGEALGNACTAGELWCGHSLLCAVDGTVKYQDQEPGPAEGDERLRSAGAVEAITMDSINPSTSPGIFILDVEGLAYNPFPPMQVGSEVAVVQFSSTQDVTTKRYFWDDGSLVTLNTAMTGGRLPLSIGRDIAVPDGAFDILRSGIPTEYANDTSNSTTKWSPATSLEQLGWRIHSQSLTDVVFLVPPGEYSVWTITTFQDAALANVTRIYFAAMLNATISNELVNTQAGSTADGNGVDTVWHAKFACEEGALLDLKNNTALNPKAFSHMGCTILVTRNVRATLTGSMLRPRVRRAQEMYRKIQEELDVQHDGPVEPQEDDKFTQGELELLAKFRKMKLLASNDDQ